MTSIVIVSHGSLGQSLLRTAESILGKQADVRVVSNRNLSVKGLAEKLGNVLSRAPWRHDSIVLVDMQGGSCWTAACLATRDRPAVLVVGGMNLAMLLSFFSKRTRMARDPLAAAMVEAAQNSVAQY